MILQDPQTSLNPVFTIGNQLIEAIQIHHQDGHRSLVRRAIDGLKQVRVAAPSVACGLPAPDERRHEAARRRRHRHLLRAAVIIADEPTTSLDVTIQAQYLRLLREIQERRTSR